LNISLRRKEGEGDPSFLDLSFKGGLLVLILTNDSVPLLDD
jgi:hypothetical protein